MTSSMASKAILLPHYKNTRQAPKGEWVLTAVLGENGTILQGGRDMILGIYPTKAVAEVEVTRHLRQLGAVEPKLEFVALLESTWRIVREALKLPSGEDCVWQTFARSKSNQEVITCIGNYRRAIGRDQD